MFRPIGENETKSTWLFSLDMTEFVLCRLRTGFLRSMFKVYFSRRAGM